MVKSFLGLSLGLNIVLWLAAIALAKDVPDSGKVCVPLYDATGLECIDGACVGK
jgi:hypothetical protein